MKIVMMGSGGVGGYFGARLVTGGADVHFVARGPHLAAMRRQGLTIEGGSAPLHLSKVQATDDPSSIGTADFVLIAVKLWDTEAAIEQVRPIVGPHTTVISFQNGVLKDKYLVERFGASRIMGGVGYVATAIDRPGVIRQTGPLQRLLFGELDGTISGRGQRLLEICLKGGIAAQLSSNIQREIWQKFVFLVGLSRTTTTILKPIGPIRETTQTRAFLRDVMREAVAVARAEAIDLPADYAEQRLALADDVAYDMTSSMHHDLDRGNLLEVRWLSGGVVELGGPLGKASLLCTLVNGEAVEPAGAAGVDERLLRTSLAHMRRVPGRVARALQATIGMTEHGARAFRRHARIGIGGHRYRHLVRRPVVARVV
jgi:2-dehydropantoate 2-reductase